MTKGEAKQLETDVVIFPMVNEFDEQEIVKSNEGTDEITVKGESVKSNLENRYTRLKKSLRKRSASIL